MKEFFEQGWPFWLGLAVATVLAFPIFRLLLRMKSQQQVSQYAPETHQVKQGTPTMGGLLFILPFIMVGPWLGVSSPIIWLVAAFAAIGFIDDYVVPRLMAGKRGLGWKQKIIGQFIVAALFEAFLREPPLMMSLGVFMILFFSNAYNFADGLDGLASSVGLLFIIGLVFICRLQEGEGFSPALLLLGGAMLPFAFLNAPKAKVFMGDVGSLAVGALLGATVTQVAKQGIEDYGKLLPIAILSVVLMAELLPVPLQIFWVKVFKKRLFLMTPIHHAFERKGWKEGNVVLAFATVQLLATGLAIFLAGWKR